MTEILRTDMLPKPLYRGLKALTLAWPGERVSKESLLIKIHNLANAKKPPLIWVGGPVELNALIQTVGAERTIYGMRGTFDFADPTEAVIDLLSEYYTQEILHHIPNQPYCLAANCDAAYIIMEIGRRLTERGHKVVFTGLVELDLTEVTTELSFAKKIFKITDRLGRAYYKTRNYFENVPFSIGMQTLLRQLGFRKKTKKIDSRNAIMYSDLTTSPLYSIKPYPTDINLIYIRWGGFGYVQFERFKNYWRKLCKGSVTTDIISGWSHEFPNWNAITKKLNERMNAAGLNFFLMLDWQSQPCFQSALWAI